jgi:glycosidase
MPDLNFREPAVLKELESVVGFWMRQGVDGFRLDAARHLVEEDNGILSDASGSHEVARALKRAMRRVNPEGVLLAEAWADTETVAAYAGQGDEYDLAFGFDFAEAAKQAVLAGDPAPFEEALRGVERTYRRRGFDAPFLTNHDMDRLRTLAEGREAPLRAAFTLLLTAPGSPFLYYGEENGMPNAEACTGDICRRAPMAWSPQGGFTTGVPWTDPAPDPGAVNVEAQRRDPKSLWSWVRALVLLRAREPALRSTDHLRLPTDQEAVYAFLRGKDPHPILVVVNLGEVPRSAVVDLSPVGRPGRALGGENLLDLSTLEVPADRSRFRLPELAPGESWLVRF